MILDFYIHLWLNLPSLKYTLRNVWKLILKKQTYKYALNEKRETLNDLKYILTDMQIDKIINNKRSDHS